jgi:hypothetical protein
MDDEWDDDDEMGVAAAFVLAFTIGVVATTITAAAIIWNVADAVASLVHTVRRAR